MLPQKKVIIAIPTFRRPKGIKHAMRSLWHKIKTQTRAAYSYEHYKNTLAGLIRSVVNRAR